MDNDLSSLYSIEPSVVGLKKLGHPHPESNLLSDSNKGVPQQTQVYSPRSLEFQNSPVNARSVAPSRVTLYCVSFNRSSQNDFGWFFQSMLVTIAQAGGTIHGFSANCDGQTHSS